MRYSRNPLTREQFLVKGITNSSGKKERASQQDAPRVNIIPADMEQRGHFDPPLEDNIYKSLGQLATVSWRSWL